MINKALFIIAISFVFLSCGTNQNKQVDISSKDTLNINIGSEPPSLDWSLATDSTSFTILNNIMEGLTRFSSKHKPEPALAESWDISEDGKTYTFNIRKNVFWSDGKALKADDFVFSWKRLLKPETGADYAYFLFDIENAEQYNSGKINDPNKIGLTTKDDNTLIVKLKRPATYFPSLLTFMSTFPMREDIVEKHENKWTSPENIVTIGPYKLTKWKHHDVLEISEYENYWGEKVKNAKKVKMIMNENPTSTLALYESGELDFLDSKGLPLLEIPRLKKSKEFVNKLAYRGFYIAFNTKKFPFNNADVRKAFGSAIDRENLMNLLQGAGVPSTSWIPIGMLAHNPDIGLKFNPEKARDFLKKAGYGDSKEFPEVTFLYPDVGNTRITAEALQSMWKMHLGIEVKLINQEWKVYLKTLDTDAPHIFRAGWGADFPDPHNFMNLFECLSGNNETGWCNQEYDNLVETAAEEQNEQKRIELYNKAQKILTEQDTAIVPFRNAVQQNMIKSYIKGLEPDPLNLIYFNKVEFVSEN